MAYYLYDLYHDRRKTPAFRHGECQREYGTAQNRWVGNPMRFNTKEELLAFWYVHCSHTWENLNITGNDIIMCLESHYFETTLDGMSLVKYLYAPYLRRYLVTDSAGRHQDIRNWNLDVKSLPQRPSLCGLYSSGAKQHWHRASGPSMWRRTTQAADAAAHQDGVDLEERVPPVRNKAVLSWLDQDGAYEKHCFGRHSRCWKDQSKAGSQYHRHAKASKGKRGQTPQSDDSFWKNLIADGFPVCPATAESVV